MPGVVREFDVDDVAALVAPRKLELAPLLDERRDALSAGKARAAFKTAADAYRVCESARALRL